MQGALVEGTMFSKADLKEAQS